MRVLVLLEVDSSLDGGLGGRGLQPAGSDDSDVGRDDVSAMDVGLDDAGGVGGRVWKDERLLVNSLRRSSRTRRSPRRWGYGSAAGPTTVAEEALVDAEVAEAFVIASDAWSPRALEIAELEEGLADLCGVSSTTVKRMRAPGQERPR